MSAARRTAYTTVLFDLFDTLVRFDRTRLPSVRIEGRELQSSVGLLYPLVAAAVPGVTLDRVYAAFSWSYAEAERRRAGDHREICAHERFGFLYERLGVAVGSVSEEITERLLAVHMACLAAAAEAVPEQQELLGWLRGRYRLGVVSNFDYTPTVQRILADAGLLDCFGTVVVSDSVGWRKPGAAIFEAAFARLGVEPGECLFVGDRPDVDVLGAKGVGMSAVWLNPGRVPLPAGLPAPDFDVAGLGEVRLLLEDGAQRPAKTA